MPSTGAISGRTTARLLLAFVGVALIAGCTPVTSPSPMAPGIAGHLPTEARREAQRETYLRLADSARAGGDTASAIGMYRQAIAADRDHPEAYVRLGEALIELGAYDEAAEAFGDARRFAPERLDAKRGYARALVGLARPEVAIAYYQDVLTEDARDLAALNGLGVAYDLSGRHGEAQAVYRQALDVAPHSAGILNNYGLSLALAGDHAGAVEMLREVVGRPGASARHRQNLALAYGLGGDMMAAETVARLDLDETAVQNNLRYFAALRGIEDGGRQALAIGTTARPTTASPERPDPRATERAQRLQAVALEGEGLELGLVPGGRWFLDLGQYAGSRAAAQAWRGLRARHGELAPLGRLAGVEDGRQPLLVGPLATGDDARRACRALESAGQRCTPVSL